MQLPTFSVVSVTTTVSVPDGGTVLLGGIKRLSEGRNEFGVPILSKLPYINRLFKNVGIGRETQSLMMMVTPRIIIQEEEEERLRPKLLPVIDRKFQFQRKENARRSLSPSGRFVWMFRSGSRDDAPDSLAQSHYNRS